MRYFLSKKKLNNTLIKAEKALFESPKVKFQKSREWRESHVPNYAGVYALFNNKEELLYIGQSGDIRSRMNNLNTTGKHSFRRQYGKKKFDGIMSKRRFEDKVEKKLDEFFKNKLYVSFLETNFGRLEIEEYLVSKYKNKLYNS